MLLAVEGGGFFSSSASGYSKGLTLLLLGQKNEEKPMRVTPWNQYQLVNQDTGPDLQLASGKNRFVRGCASFVCFGSAAAGLESPSPLKVGPAQQQEVLPQPPASEKSRDQIQSSHVADDCNSDIKVTLKSSLKKPSTSNPVADDGSDERVALCRKDSDAVVHTETRKVQWTDTSGGELVEIQEFELREKDVHYLSSLKTGREKELCMIDQLPLLYCIKLFPNSVAVYHSHHSRCH